MSVFHQMPSTMNDILAMRALQTPERMAYIFESKKEQHVQTDQSLFQEALSLASRLRAVVRDGDRVLLLFPPGPEYTVAFYGCLLAGVVAVPFYPPSRRRRDTALVVIKDCKPKAILVGKQQQTAVAAMLADNDLDIRIGLPPIEEVDVLTEPVAVDAQQLAFLQYTSGSTGTPKGVMVRHRDLLANEAAIAETFETDAQDICVSWLPLYHDMGLIGAMLHAMYRGFTSVLLSPIEFLRNPLSWLQAVTRHKATLCGGPNFAYELCVRQALKQGIEGLNLSSLRLAFNGAEPIRPETLDAFHKTFAPAQLREGVMFPCYGMAEATLFISGGHYRKGLCVDREALSKNKLQVSQQGEHLVGVGVSPSHVRIVDPESGGELPPGHVGEIWFDGPGMTAGYWQRETETAESFGATLEGEQGKTFLRTGDMGAVFEGQLYVTGRLKDLIIIRGRNYYPQDIERIASDAHEALQDQMLAAVSVANEGEESLVVLAETERKLEVESLFGEIEGKVREAIAAYTDLHLTSLLLVPIGSLPKTSSGKIRRKACAQFLQEGKLSIRAQTVKAANRSHVQALSAAELKIMEPHEALEKLGQFLCGELARLLGQDDAAIDREKALVTLGLDSLMAAEISAMISDRFQADLEPEMLLDGWSVSQVAEHILSAFGKGGCISLPTEANEHDLSVEQERLWLLSQMVEQHSAHHIPAAFRIKGRIDGERLREAVRAVARRHDSLRTRFLTINGEGQRDVLSEIEVPYSEEDLRGSTSEDPESSLQLRLDGLIEEAFDLGCPPWRVALLRLEDDVHVLVVVLHHIIADLLSLKIFLEDLSTCYRGDTPGLTASYGQFVSWQQLDLDSSQRADDLKWWQEKLEQLPAPMALPTDHPRPEVSQRQTAVHHFELDRSLVNRLRQWSSVHEVTVYTTLMAAFKVMLQRYSSLDDLVVASPVSGRPFGLHEDGIGFYAYPVVVRTHMDEDSSLLAVLKRVRSSTIEAGQHAQSPGAVMGAVRPKLSPGWHPLFQTMFSFFDREYQWSLGDLTTERLKADPKSGDLDLFLTLVRLDEGLEGIFCYNPELFQQETVAALVSFFEQILGTFLDDVDKKLSDISLPGLLKAGVAAARARDKCWRLTLAGNFTAEPLEDSLAFWLSQRQLQHEIQFAPYNQVFAQLLDVQNGLYANDPDYAFVLLRLAEWYDPEQPSKLAEHVSELLGILGNKVPACPLLLVCCPAGIEVPAVVELETRRLVEAGADLANVWALDAGNLVEIYDVADMFNAHTMAEAHIPYTQEWFAALGTMCMRWMDSLQRRPFKVVALDCDHTLWGGVIGESRWDKLDVTGPYVVLQGFMKQRKQAGSLLALCSKNEESDVTRVFEKREDMPLSLDDVSALYVNWQPKSENLQALAVNLDLGLDSIVFVDDNPLEIAEVEANCPAVTAICLPEDTATIHGFLTRHWAFDHFGVSSEDKRRTEMYKENKLRQDAVGKAPSLAEFIASLDLQIDIRPMENMGRAAQLNERTNQFRCHPARYDAVALLSQLEQGAVGREITVRDRFGDYGIVGQILCRKEDHCLLVSSFLLSCRAMGRGVEHQMLAWIGDQAQQAGVAEVEILFEETERNIPAKKFLEGVVGGNVSEHGFIFSAEVAAAVRFDASSPGEEASTSAKPKKKLVTQSLWEPPQRDLMAADAATLLTFIREASAERARSNAAPQAHDTVFVPPETPLQEELAQLFHELLGVDQVSIHDNFMAKGGYSLQGVKLINRIQESYGVELPLALFFEGATVAKLAENIELLQIEQAGTDEFDSLMDELEGLSEEEIMAMLAEEEGS